MSKNLVKKEDVINLLETIVNEQDYVEKGELLVSIRTLRIYNDDNGDVQPEQSIIQNKRRSKVYHINDHLQAINKYRQEVKVGIRKSHIHIHLESHLGLTINKNDLKIFSTREGMRIKDKGKDSYFSYCDATEFSNVDLLLSEQQLIDIFNISKGTVNTWKRKGIIKLYRKRIKIIIKDTVYKYRGYWLRYYDLDDIRKELKDIKD